MLVIKRESFGYSDFLDMLNNKEKIKYVVYPPKPRSSSGTYRMYFYIDLENKELEFFTSESSPSTKRAIHRIFKPKGYFGEGIIVVPLNGKQLEYVKAVILGTRWTTAIREYMHETLNKR